MTKNETDMALIASVFGNLIQASDKAVLQRGKAYLQGLVADWQQAYHEIDVQLVETNRLVAQLRQTNEALSAQVADARRSRDQARTETHAATKRAMDLDTKLAVALLENKRLKAMQGMDVLRAADAGSGYSAGAAGKPAKRRRRKSKKAVQK